MAAGLYCPSVPCPDMHQGLGLISTCPRVQFQNSSILRPRPGIQFLCIDWLTQPVQLSFYTCSSFLLGVYDQWCELWLDRFTKQEQCFVLFNKRTKVLEGRLILKQHSMQMSPLLRSLSSPETNPTSSRPLSRFQSLSLVPPNHHPE